MEFRKNTSTNQWLDFWLTKYSVDLEKRKLTEETKKLYNRVLKNYLTLHPGNPRTIDIQKLLQFLTAINPGEGAALTLFYDFTAHSKDHLDVIETYKEQNN